MRRLEEYTEKTKIPILAEFAYQNRIARQELYAHPELADAIKELIDKKEFGLERLMLSGKPGVAAGCIFSLKQLGWKDKQEVEHTGKDGKALQLVFVTGRGPGRPEGTTD